MEGTDGSNNGAGLARTCAGWKKWKTAQDQLSRRSSGRSRSSKSSQRLESAKAAEAMAMTER